MNTESLHSGYFNDVLRTWQSRTSKINPDCLIYPVFISSEEKGKLEEISSAPGHFKVSSDRVNEYLKPKIEAGLKTVLLCNTHEDFRFLQCHSNGPPSIAAVKKLRVCFPRLNIACELCTCERDVNADQIPSSERMSAPEMAVNFARSGVDVIVLTENVDGQVKSIDEALRNQGLRARVSIISTPTKFSSSFYGPFKDVTGTTHKEIKENLSNGIDTSETFKRGEVESCCGNQLSVGASGLAMRAAKRDIAEGTDMIVVQPSAMYMDVIRKLKEKHPKYPIAARQVSGEYAMFYYGAKCGAFDLKQAVYESIESVHRAGADVIISYFAADIMQWLKEDAVAAEKKLMAEIIQ